MTDGNSWDAKEIPLSSIDAPRITRAEMLTTL